MLSQNCVTSDLGRLTPADENPRSQAKGLSAVFRPGSVAVVGASPTVGKLGHVVFRNLIEAGFEGRLGAVNLKHCKIRGHQAVASLRELEQPPDLVVIAVPAASVEAVIDDSVAVGAGAAVILSAGFDQLGTEAGDVTGRILRKSRAAGLRLVGPNCLGVL